MQKRVSLAVGEGLGPSRQSSETLERKSWDREGRPYR